MRLVTHRPLSYPPERVWSVLADFDRYADWNPLNVSAVGRAEPGARISMTFIDPGRPGATIWQTVTVVACDPPCRLAWRGHVPVLFTGVHFFELEPARGGTDLTHGEDLSGLMPWTWTPKRRAHQIAAYERMNDALEQRLEQTSF